ncbi:tellurite resistance TerB family protein [Thermomonas fusca]
MHEGESIEIAGTVLPGGLVYVGPRLKAPNGIVEPALINPNLSVSGQGDCRDQHTNYSPSYSNLSPEGRRAYLHWLSTGRSHPDCDIGLVFLFFYGLERRVIVDSENDSAAKKEWPIILAELRRLLDIYGQRSDSFRRYAGDLLSWIELDGASPRLYEQPIPDFPRTYEMPPYLRLALGQASMDRKPVPAGLALSWVRLSPEIYLRTPATRCPDEFGRLFAHRYREFFSAGLVLPKNRTKLKFSYRPASLGLIGVNVSLGFGDIPDVTALTTPIKKLAEIVEQCTNELAAYSRLIGKDPGAGGTVEGLLLLPTAAWPDAVQAMLETLTARVSEGFVSLLLSELLDSLGGTKLPMNRERLRNLARTLESVGIGLEPDVLAGAKTPAEQDTVILFEQPILKTVGAPRAEYQTAALTLQLASAMTQADGDFHARELAHLQAEIEGWAHLSLAERRRLHAHLQWLTISPMSLAALKKKLEPLPTQAREILATFMATLAQSDGLVSPEEVRFLEKIYKTLGVEPKRVFSDIHAAEAGRAPISISRVEKQGFRLDAQRIAALQEDTARVSALLSSIFAEEPTSSSAPSGPALEPEVEVEVEVESESDVAATAPLGLDESHAALLRLLLSRPTWTRAELEDAATDLDLMLDGALEQINEAAFDAFDEPLLEGDDPITVNVDLIETIA